MSSFYPENTTFRTEKVNLENGFLQIINFVKPYFAEEYVHEKYTLNSKLKREGIFYMNDAQNGYSHVCNYKNGFLEGLYITFVHNKLHTKSFFKKGSSFGQRKFYGYS
jgi:hypothetical protein